MYLLFQDMVEYFVSQGYVRGKSIRAAPYDFRFAPHSQETSFLLNVGRKGRKGRKKERKKERKKVRKKERKK